MILSIFLQAQSFGVFETLTQYGALGVIVLGLGAVLWYMLKRQLASEDELKKKVDDLQKELNDYIKVDAGKVQNAASSASSVSVASLSGGERATRTPCAANASTSAARSVSKSPTIRWRVRPSGAAARAPPSTPITRSASDQPGHAASSAARVGWSPPARISARRCPHSLSHRAPASPFAGMTRIRFVGSRVLPFLSALWRSPVAMR